MKEFEITTDSSRVDIDMVHKFLRISYWAKNRPRSVIETCIKYSLCFSGFLDNKQVTFSRVITDRAVFGYIADVFVLPEYRGRGYANRLMSSILEHPEVRDLKLTLLATRDAHGLYEKFGFKRISGSEKAMSIFTIDGD